MATINIDLLTSSSTLATGFVANDLTLIKLNIDGAGAVAIGSLTKPATVTGGVITIPGYGTLTLNANDKVTFKADATLTGTLELANTNTAKFTIADLSSATGALTVTTVAADLLTITGGAGADVLTAGAGTTTITSGAGNDTVTSGAATTAINAGDGDDVINHGTTAVSTITAGAGNDKVVLAAGATGANVILLGDGDDTIQGAAAGKASVTLGLGVDVVSVASGAAELNVTDYSYAQGDKIVNVAAEAGTLSNTGVFTAGTKLTVNAEAVDNVYKVNYTTNGVAEEDWTAKVGTNSVTMNGSTLNTVMNINAAGATNAVIQGGYKNDAITLGTAQATITSSKSSGSDAITGFTEGFSGDVINLSGATVSDLSFGAGKVNISGIEALTGFTNWTLATNTEGALLVQENGGATKKVAFATATGGKITNLTADAYVGFTDKTTVLDLAASTVEGATIDLNNSAKYTNIVSVKGAAGGGTYIGATGVATNNSFDLSAATKGTQVWGGLKGTDVVSLDSAKAVQDIMWFGKTDGTDTVTNFGFGFGATKDIVNLYDVADVTALDITEGGANNAVITTATGNTVSLVGVAAGSATQLQLKNQAGVVSKLALGIKSAVNVDINGIGADMVIGKAETTTNLNTVKYATSTTGLTANLLDTTKYKNIHNVDLTGSTGDGYIVVGSADTVTGSNLKLAGTTAAVWGGSKAADTITTGTGADTIWFGTNDGADSVDAGFSLTADKVKFYDKAVSEFTTAYTYAVAGGNGTFTAKAAGSTDSLALKGLADDVTFNLIDKNNTEVKAVAGTTNLNYVSGAKVYMSGTAGSTLTVSSTDNVVLYLGNGKDAAFNDTYLAGVSVINAAGSVGNTTLIGEKSVGNDLKGGKVSSAMWGGGMSSDTMTGQTSAVDQYWFGTGDGMDSVVGTGVDKSDTVVLYNAASINDVTLTAGTNQEVIAMKDGSMLTIGDTGNAALTAGLTFQVGTGASAKSYTYNTTTKAFVAK